MTSKLEAFIKLLKRINDLYEIVQNFFFILAGNAFNFNTGFAIAILIKIPG